MRIKRLIISAASLFLATAGGFGAAQHASAAGTFSFDTGSGLTFTIDGGNGNLTSLKHDGVELASGPAGQFESGWSSASVTAKTFDNGNAELFSAANTSIGVTQYYFARKGDNTIYLATDGTTASKFYSSEPFIAQQPFGASGHGHGVFIVAGTHEMSSGGPFFRDIEVNDTGSAVNITNYLYSGHAQTEPTMRLGLHGPYAMAVTGGSPPSASLSMDFLSSYIPGLLSDAQRGTVTGSASGSWGGRSGTVALSGPDGEYWAPVSNGSFTIGKIRPGTYTATLYAGQLAIGGTATATVSAGHTSTIALSGDVPANGSIFQLGTWDGTPAGFLNADKIETMHPSDTRMSPWTAGSVNVSAGAGAVPMALFKSVNSPLLLNFPLTSVPSAGATLRIGITIGFAGGRPAVSIGGWNSPSSASPPSVDLHSRSITRGTWRGVNQTYTFAIPASALHTGTNTLSVSVVSGSSGTTYLSPAFVFDAIALGAG